MPMGVEPINAPIYWHLIVKHGAYTFCFLTSCYAALKIHCDTFLSDRGHSMAPCT